MEVIMIQNLKSVAETTDDMQTNTDWSMRFVLQNWSS